MLTILCWATFIALFGHGLDTMKDLNKVVDRHRCANSRQWALAVLRLGLKTSFLLSQVMQESSVSTKHTKRFKINASSLTKEAKHLV